MSVVYRASLKTTRMQAVRDDIDSGAGAGTLEIGDAGFATVLVSITLDDPASTVSGDTLTIAGVPKDGTASATGTAAEARGLPRLLVARHQRGGVHGVGLF